MKLLPGIALLFALGCADSSAELPPMEVGSGGARLMTGSGRSPEENYEIAYAQLHKQHINVRRALEPRGRNLYGASLSMQSILDSFARMRSLVTPPHQVKFDPWIAKYQEWQKLIERDTWGGSFMQDFDIAERRVKETFSIDNVELAAAAVPAPAPVAKEPAPRPADPAPPKEAAPGIPPDKVVPPPHRPDPAPGAPKAPATAERPPTPAPAPAANGRIYYKAWDGFHDALIAAYKATPRPDCRPKFEDLRESLLLLKSTLPPDRGQKLQIYIDYYAAMSEKTKAFSSLPEKTTDKDILDELDVVARVLRKEFNPDR